MAFEEGISSSQEDFASKFRTFAVSVSGWTEDEFSAASDRMSLSKNGIFFHWGWDNSNDIEVHQSVAFGAAGAPDSHTNDSGNGGLGTADRALNDIGNGPFIKHTFFSGSSPTEHLYAVLEHAPGQYRHFGACNIIKEGDWTGGETVVCTTWLQTSASAQNNGNHCVMMDGGCNQATRCGTMHIEGLPDQTASGKWGIFAFSVAPGNDGDAIGRENLLGGMRGGPYSKSMGAMPSSKENGFIPLITVPCFYRRPAESPIRNYLLGYYPNIRVINMNDFQPGDVFLQGADTWHVFPMIRRQAIGGIEEQTGFGGIAYKQT